VGHVTVFGLYKDRNVVISHMVYQLFQFVKVSMFWYSITIKYAAFDKLFAFFDVAAGFLLAVRLLNC